MRILQIIDSLEAGGAERMAVNYANALVDKIDFSGLVVTRKEGALRNQLSKKVAYLFLNKKKAIDSKALFKLRHYVVQNQVTHIHAHSTSFFMAFLLKITYPKIQLIWHDHYGNSEFLESRPVIGLKIILPFFGGIIAVNQKLKRWSEEKKLSKKILYLPNFPSKESDVSEHTFLKGTMGKRIVSLANLRIQKNHFLLVEVAKMIKKSHPDWTFHLVGKDFEDDYSQEIKNLISEFELENVIFIYGSKQDIKNILEQSTIAILTSQSEGLPVALLEYGWHGKPVVVTNVGEIPMLIQNGSNGFIVETNVVSSFYEVLIKLIESDTLQINFGETLRQDITNNYSEETIVNEYINWVQNSCK
jgi:glycosyltransferase involved in cell wall biosynthesis